MESKTITEEFIYRMDNELKFHTNLYKKEGEPFGSQELSSMAGGSLPAVDLWHGLWYQGEMACLFGEPNVGKTILAMQIANEVCRRGLKTLYFDFENAAHQFKPRYSTDKYDYMSNDASFIVKPLNPNHSTVPLDSRSILDYIKKDFVTERAPVIIIDDITHLIGTGDQADVRHVLNTLRSWTQHYLVSILVLAHSKRRKWSSLTTIESLAGSFEYSYAFDSIFSLTRANEYNAQTNNVTHYIKHHKNRMGPVLYNDMNVITAQFGRDEGNGFLQFNELYTGGNERQLLRDNGYDTFEKINQAIMHYKSLHFSTREIAGIVGCSQSHVSRTIRRNEVQQEKSTASTNSNDSTLSPLHSSLSTITWLPSTMPRIKLEPDLTPIYDASKYTIDPYGQRVTVEEYNQYFNEDEEEQENFFNPFADDDYEEDEFDDDDWDDWDDDNDYQEETAPESTASRESSTPSKSTEPAEPTESAESSESGESNSSNDSVNVLGDAVAVKKPVLNINSSLKKLMKKSSKK